MNDTSYAPRTKASAGSFTRGVHHPPRYIGFAACKMIRRILGFAPRDGFMPHPSPEDVEEDRAAREARLVPGQWLDQRFRPLRG